MARVGGTLRHSDNEMKLTHKDRWEQGFTALGKFRRRKGHCCPPQRHVEGKYNLGAWVITQRYRKDDLSVERKRRLDRIGFVWNGRDFAWERGFAALLNFKRREGHCRVRHSHREGDYKLGSWVVVQRKKKNVMSPKRRARLNKVGFVWNVYRRR
jgi:Helicase associated domain